MRYREFQPRAELAALIECFWTLADTSETAPASPERILPDGCVELILNFADHFRQIHDDGSSERQPLQFVVGQMDRYLLIEPTGAVDVLGIRFRPDGAFPFLRLSLEELTGRVEPLDAVAPKMARDLARAVFPARRTRDRLAVLERILLALLRRNGATDPAVGAVVRAILRRNGKVSVAALGERMGMSLRQLERKFEQLVGLSPKQLARIIRFQSVFRSAGCTPAPAWAEVALDCGYYDQAHFIREFKQLSGQSPAALFAAGSPLTEVFTRKNRR